MTTRPGRHEGGSVIAARSVGGAGSIDVDCCWSRSDGGDDPSVSDHGSDVLEWRPGYQHEVAVLARMRHVSCPDDCEETPAVVLRIDNADPAGEVAMSADDVSAIVEVLLALRRALLATAQGRTDR